MFLRNKQAMTAEKISANRRNGRHWHGPSTPEGRDRIHAALLKESVKGPSPYERAAEIAPTHPHAMLMRRLQDSYLREVRRVANLLLKLKCYERKMGTELERKRR
jgi:hypothetical protein